MCLSVGSLVRARRLSGDSTNVAQCASCIAALFDALQLGYASEESWLAVSSAALSLHRRVLALALCDRPKVRRRALECVQALHAARPHVPRDFGGVTRRLCERAVAPDAATAADGAADADAAPAKGAAAKGAAAKAADDGAADALLQNTLRVLALMGYDDATSSAGKSVVRGLAADDADAMLALLAACALTPRAPAYAQRAALHAVALACADDGAGRDAASLSADACRTALRTLLAADAQLATPSGGARQRGGAASDDTGTAYGHALASLTAALARVDAAAALEALPRVVRLLVPLLRGNDTRARLACVRARACASC